jgi:hypothetical protein
MWGPLTQVRFPKSSTIKRPCEIRRQPRDNAHLANGILVAGNADFAMVSYSHSNKKTVATGRPLVSQDGDLSFGFIFRRRGKLTFERGLRCQVHW